MATIQIPIRGRESVEVLEVAVNELPSDAIEIVDILKAELAPLSVWLRVAVEYYKQGKHTQFVEVLSEVAAPQDVSVEHFKDQVTERIQILTALACHSINLAAKEAEERRKKELHAKASDYLATAMRINPSHPLPHVGTGLLALSQADVDKAAQHFKSAQSLSHGPTNIPAILGMACTQFNKGQYSDALTLFRNVLKINGPNCPPNVRLGIGLCLYRLGNFEKARLAFDRVLQLDEHNVEALVALAVMELNKGTEESVRLAMTHLKRAYEFNHTNSMVLNHLANHFFYRRAYDKTQNLALSAFHLSNVKEIRGESFYYMARSYHAQHDFDNAFKYYHQMTLNYPNFALGRFGIGQLCIYRNEIDKAIEHFEFVLQQYPDNFETLKVLGWLYADESTKEAPEQSDVSSQVLHEHKQQQAKYRQLAITHLNKAHSLRPDDEEVLIQLAGLQLHDPKAALKSYEKAQKLIESKGKTVAYQLWNNIAIMKQRLGYTHYKDAEQCFQRAMESAGVTLQAFDAEHVALIFNVARLYEDMHRGSEATELYKAIGRAHPQYVEAFLRIAYMAFEAGRYSEAMNWCQLVAEIDPRDTTAWSFMGMIHLKRDEGNLAQEKFERALAIDKNDVFALLALGHIFFNGVRPEAKEREEKHANHAFGCFERVLRIDNNNAYAALNIGALLAETGYFDTAKDVLTNVRKSAMASDAGSAADSMPPETLLNLAHLYVAQKQYANASKLYENVLKKYYNNCNPKVMQYLAKSHYEAKNYQQCQNVLQKAIHLAPNNHTLWFDLALAKMGAGLQRLTQRRLALVEVTAIIADLKVASRLFTLVEQRKDKLLAQRARVNLDTINTALNKANNKLAAAEAEEMRANQLREQHLNEFQEQMSLQEQQKLKEEERRQEEEERMRRLLEENERRMEELRNVWRIQDEERERAAERAAASSRKRGKSIRTDEAGNGSDEEEHAHAGEEETETPKKRGGKSKKKARKSKSAESSGDMPKKGKRKSSKGGKHSRSEDAEEAEADMDAETEMLYEDHVHVNDEGEAEVTFDGSDQQPMFDTTEAASPKRGKKRRLQSNRSRDSPGKKRSRLDNDEEEEDTTAFDEDELNQPAEDDDNDMYDQAPPIVEMEGENEVTFGDEEETSRGDVTPETAGAGNRFDEQ